MSQSGVEASAVATSPKDGGAASSTPEEQARLQEAMDHDVRVLSVADFEVVADGADHDKTSAIQLTSASTDQEDEEDVAKNPSLDDCDSSSDDDDDSASDDDDDDEYAIRDDEDDADALTRVILSGCCSFGKSAAVIAAVGVVVQLLRGLTTFTVSERLALCL